MELNITLQPKQRKALEESQKTPVYFYGGAKGGGKAQSLDSRVLTPSGFRRMGDLSVGDKVVDPKGKEVTVVQIHPQGKKQLYQIKFIDGSQTLVTKDHLWKYKIVGRPHRWLVSDTRTLIGRLKKAENSKATVTPNILIPISGGVDFEEKKLPIPPYVLGILIAEGSLTGNSVVFITNDDFVVKKIRAYGYPVNTRKRINNRCINDGSITRRKLKILGLWGKKSEGKFVPNVYLKSSRKQRLGVLRGLMDGDGYIDKRGHIEYTAVSERLAQDVRFLVKSLGGTATTKEHKSSYLAPCGKRVKAQNKFRIYVRCNKSVFSLPRKKARHKPYNGGLGKKRLRLLSIEKHSVAEAQCISLDSKDGLYVTDDFIVTHNSHLVRARELVRRMRYPNSKGLIIRKTYSELLSNHIREFFNEYKGVRDWYNKAEKAIYWPNGSITEFSYLKNTDDVYTYQGREYEDISIDEITQHEETVFKILRSSNRTSNKAFAKKTIPTMFLTGNPGGPGHSWTKRLFIDRDFTGNENPKDFRFLQAKVYDNRALLDADPDYIKRLLDLPERFRRAYLEGDWDIFAGQVFMEFRRDKHVIKPMHPSDDYPHYLGIDWGYSGRDKDKGAFAALSTALIREKHDGLPFNRLITYKEWYGKRKSSEEWAERIYKDSSVKYRAAIMDSAMFNPSTDGSTAIAERMEEKWRDLHGGYWTQNERGTRNRVGSVEAIHNWMKTAPDGNPYWLITRNCKDLIRTIPLMVHDSNKPEDIDTDTEDHLVDAARYLLSYIKYIPAHLGGTAGHKEKHIHKPKQSLDLKAFEDIQVKKSKDWRYK